MQTLPEITELHQKLRFVIMNLKIGLFKIIGDMNNFGPVPHAIYWLTEMTTPFA
jgi:hypothetical protein